MKKSKLHPNLNVRLLRRIQKHILEEPRRFFMESVVVATTPGSRKWDESASWFTDLSRTVPPCGTAACIHGWTALLSGKTIQETEDLRFRWSQNKLGLSPSYQIDNLFIAEYWPSPFDGRYLSARGPKQRAKIACARIDHLIETGY